MRKKRGLATTITNSSNKFYIAICKEMCLGKQSMWYFSVLQNSLDEFCYAYIYLCQNLEGLSNFTHIALTIHSINIKFTQTQHKIKNITESL